MNTDQSRVCRQDVVAMDPDAQSQCRHRSFHLTPGCRAEHTAIREIAAPQLGSVIAWILLFPVFCWCESPMPMIWLPINYLSFDLYLLARDWRGARWRESSKAVRGFVGASPFVMIGSARLLGMVGTWLNEALWP